MEGEVDKNVQEVPMDLTLRKNLQKDKLLVLDLDKTLCSFGTNELDNNNPTIPRPYLYEFLKSVYEYYDIMIWSATSRDSTIKKLETLNMINNEAFDITFVLSQNQMINKYKESSGMLELTKPLRRIWNIYEQYTTKNTIIVDNSPINYCQNVSNGLPIIPYEQDMHGLDDELLHIRDYLIKLAKNCSDFSTVDHEDFKTYNPAP